MLMMPVRKTSGFCRLHVVDVRVRAAWTKPSDTLNASSELERSSLGYGPARQRRTHREPPPAAPPSLEASPVSSRPRPPRLVCRISMSSARFGTTARCVRLGVGGLELGEGHGGGEGDLPVLARCRECPTAAAGNAPARSMVAPPLMSP
ncbi:hypothetical protein BRADI_5g05176v3 [Brachypodium distachyon]|uniref:Uncharacterized protein n=1 Tax=Brachypodium distachyon TaxID=15368 RepID=A0A0Q3I7K2_BRADI|nr:hypothetical protein BRADI_5g05176v3 [Brachypodium distachyon]